MVSGANGAAHIGHVWQTWSVCGEWGIVHPHLDLIGPRYAAQSDGLRPQTPHPKRWLAQSPAKVFTRWRWVWRTPGPVFAARRSPQPGVADSAPQSMVFDAQKDIKHTTPLVSVHVRKDVHSNNRTILAGSPTIPAAEMSTTMPEIKTKQH